MPYAESAQANLDDVPTADKNRTSNSAAGLACLSAKENIQPLM
jgi:hypothetical protein